MHRFVRCPESNQLAEIEIRLRVADQRAQAPVSCTVLGRAGAPGQDCNLSCLEVLNAGAPRPAE